jgi:hypothetical protein
MPIPQIVYLTGYGTSTQGYRKSGGDDLDILEGKVYTGYVSNVRLVKGIER